MGNETIAAYYANHIDELRAFFVVRTQDVELSHDLAQDVFVRLLDYRQMITETTLPSLVFVVARRLLADRYRHQQAVKRYEERPTANFVETVTPHSLCVANDLRLTVERSIATLSPLCQKVYRMNVFEGMKIGAIAETAHLNYKQAEHCLGKARRTVKLRIKSLELRISS